MIGHIDITEDFLNDLEKFYTGDDFIQFMLSNTTDISIPAFILQTLNDEVDRLRKAISEEK